LADLHGGDGGAEAFGVVTPYTAQKELIEAALQDAGASAIAVGTSHAFQGRQFGAVLVDLVEDGQGWMAAAALDKGSYAFDGLRLFNVAVTRARHRLYLLATRGALERARTGPLAVVQSLLEDGGATHVDAGELLGLSLDERPVEGTPTGDVLAALAPFVRVAGVHDEDAAIAEVIAAIEGATESVWCWSAWVGRHSTALIRALELASQRGVQVHVIARPKSEVTLSNQDSLERLVQRLPHVVHMRRMHQKIVVVDRMRSIVGSMNMLSHGATSSSRIRDIMFTIDGPRFADAVLRHQQAGELASCRRCPRCQAPLIECGLVGSGADRGWKWLCLQKDARGRGHPPLPFPAAEPAQRRARTRDR